MSGPEEIERAAELLQAGRLVAFPTETVYGLGANALDEEAIRRIFAVKQRPFTNPLIVHVASIDMARELALQWPEQARLLAERFWPGPLTLVLPKTPKIPDLVTAGLHSAGFRIPAHPVATALLKTARVPIAGPSANRFTRLSPTTAEHVREDLGSDVDLVLDGGPCVVGIESTVLSFASLQPRILRAGMITRKEIEDVIGLIGIGGGPESPGQHPRHYSPRTPLVLGDSPRQGRGARLDLKSMPSDPHSYARQIYAVLHDIDRQGYDWISVELPPDTVEWAGIRDRLMRAATKASG